MPPPVGEVAFNTPPKAFSPKKLQTAQPAPWHKSKVVKKGSANYNDLVILPDLSIGCVYETNDGAWQRIRFARFTLDWLTDGKDKIVTKE